MENKVENTNLKQENNDVKKVSEMTEEEIKNLDSVSVRIVVNTTKTGTKYFNATVKFNSQFERTFTIKPNEYLLLTKILNKEDADVLNLTGKIRIFKGTNSNGNDWYSYQLILNKYLIYSDFFAREEVPLIKIYLKVMAGFDKDCKIVNPAEAIDLKRNKKIPIFGYKINLKEKITNDDVDLTAIWGE